MAGIRVKGSWKRYYPAPEGVVPRLVIKYAGNYFCKRVKFYTPRRTGRMYRGWRCSISRNTFIVRNRVRYTSYLNSGETLARDRSKGFMIRRAWADTQKKVRKKFGIDINVHINLRYY